MTKFNGTYRTETTRLKDWDYSSPGYYFITICTRDHKPFLGQVQEDEMLLSPLGEIAQSLWLEIPAHFDNTALDEYIIMPNHVHGIVIIQEESVETQHAVSLHKPSTPCKFGPLQPGSISSIIRDDESLRSIREYIQDNPLKWALDENNPHNLYGG